MSARQTLFCAGGCGRCATLRTTATNIWLCDRCGCVQRTATSRAERILRAGLAAVDRTASRPERGDHPA